MSVLPDDDVPSPHPGDAEVGGSAGEFEAELAAQPAPPLTSPATPVVAGRLDRTVLWLAVPVLLEQFLNFCVGAVDMYLAGHLPEEGLSADATAAIGVGAYVGWLAFILYAVVAAGTTALVARSWGAGDFATANLVSNRSLSLAGVVGCSFALVIWTVAPVFAAFLDLEGAAAAIAVDYLRLDAFGLILGAMSVAGSAALRGAGDTRTPMFVFGAVSVVNVIVSSLLVYGPGPIPQFGVRGIVLGTVVARVSGGLFLLAVLLKGRSGLRLVFGQLGLFGQTTWRILRIGIPAAVDGGVLWLGHFVFLKVISWIGTTALAAHMVGIRVEAITYLPAVAWGSAAATLVGQTLGSGNPGRAARAGHAAVVQCSLFGILTTLWFLLGAEWIYATVNSDPKVGAIGAPAFRIIALAQIPLIIGNVYASALRGAGDTRFPLIMTILGTWLLRLPLAWYLGVFLEWGLMGAWLGMCGDILLRAVLAWLRFQGGRWAEIDV